MTALGKASAARNGWGSICAPISQIARPLQSADPAIVLAISTRTRPRRHAGSMLRIALVALLGCAPGVRAAGRCPTLPVQAVDFTAGAVALAASVDRYNRGDLPATVALATLAMTLWIATGVAECD